MMVNRSDKKLRILETSERSGEVPKIGAERTEPDRVLPRPDPEVPSKATRRRFSARYKLRILEQADGCEESGGVGALLRREGLYWSNLQTWRRQREEGTLQALTPRKRGRKSKPVNRTRLAQPGGGTQELLRLRQPLERPVGGQLIQHLCHPATQRPQPPPVAQGLSAGLR